MMSWASTKAMSSVNRPGVGAGHIEEIVDQPRLDLDVAMDHRHGGSDVPVQLGVAHQVRDSEQDRCQGSAQLVAQDGQELIFGPACRLGRLLGFLQLLGVAPAFSDVAKDDDCPVAYSVRIS